MGNKSSSLNDLKFLNELEKHIESECAKENSTETPNDQKDAPNKPLCNKLLFQDNYTELKILQQGQYLKWKTVTILDNGSRNVMATLGKYQIRTDKIFGLTCHGNEYFTIHALSRKDESFDNCNSVFQSLKNMGNSVYSKFKSIVGYDSNIWFQNEYTFGAQSTEHCREWLDELSTLTNCEWSEKKIMMIMNGSQNNSAALKTYDTIFPMFDAAGIEIDFCDTEKLQDTIYSSTELVNHQTLVVLGNDFDFNQVINGLLTRPDWKYDAKHIVLANIPCGSGSTISKSLGVSHPYLAALNVIRGVSQPLDILSVTSTSGFRMFSHLYMSWGFNEKISSTFAKSVYNGKLHYLDASSENIDKSTDLYGSDYEFSEAEKIAKRGPMNRYDKIDLNYLPKRWKTVDAAFTTLMAMNQPWINNSIMAAPLASANDGDVDLVFSQTGFLGLLTWLMIPSSLFIQKSKNWNYIRTPAFILEPGKDLYGKNGTLSVDGEVIPYTTIRCEVHKGLINILTPLRKVEAKISQWKANSEKWNELSAIKRSEMISMAKYKVYMAVMWAFAFAVLAIVFGITLSI